MLAELAMSPSPTTNGYAPVNGHHSDDGEQLAQLQTVSTTVLRQAIELVENTLSRDDQLLVHSRYLAGSTIGTYATLMITSSLSQRLCNQASTCAMHATTSWPW